MHIHVVVLDSIDVWEPLPSSSSSSSTRIFLGFLFAPNEDIFAVDDYYGLDIEVERKLSGILVYNSLSIIGLWAVLLPLENKSPPRVPKVTTSQPYQHVTQKSRRHQSHQAQYPPGPTSHPPNNTLSTTKMPQAQPELKKVRFSSPLLYSRIYMPAMPKLSLCTRASRLDARL
jgi:hypothetical protein